MPTRTLTATPLLFITPTEAGRGGHLFDVTYGQVLPLRDGAPGHRDGDPRHPPVPRGRPQHHPARGGGIQELRFSIPKLVALGTMNAISDGCELQTSEWTDAHAAFSASDIEMTF